MFNKKTPSIRTMFRGFDPSDQVQDYIKKKLEKTNRLLKDVLEIEIEAERNKKGQFRVELMVKTPQKLYRAEELSESVEGSTDIACEEIYVQIVKDKDRKKDLKIRGGRSIRKKISLDASARF